jgi:hypothetical protein
MRNSLSIAALFPLLPLLLLSGCSSYQEHFDCPPGKGVGCHSVSEVDALVESGHLPLGLKPFASKSLGFKPLEIWIAPCRDVSGVLQEELTLQVKGGT